MPNALEISCLVSCNDPYNQAQFLLEKLAGIFVLTTKLETTARDIGSELEGNAAIELDPETSVDESPKDSPKPQLVVVSADGGMIRVEKGWREVKTGAIYEIENGKDGALAARKKSFVTWQQPTTRTPA